jgi:hypothetical protein
MEAVVMMSKTSIRGLSLPPVDWGGVHIFTEK